METTILTSRPSHLELDKLTNDEIIRLNEDAFQYVHNIFPENVRTNSLFRTYITTFCVLPLEISHVTCRICQEILARGVKKGHVWSREKKCDEGAIITNKNTILGSSYTTYAQHHGGFHDKEAGKRQGKHTTRWFGNDLSLARKEIDNFNYILEMVEKTTGMEVMLTDLLRQSSNNEEGTREAMFKPHIDNDDDRPNSILTAICLLTDTKTSMKVFGKQTFEYKVMGQTAIFPSALFHETVFAEASTMKLAMFLRLPNTEESLKNSSCTTREQLKAVAKTSPSFSWTLQNSKSNVIKSYDSDSSGELSALSQDPRDEPFASVKHRDTYYQCKDKYYARRDRNQGFPVLQEKSTSGSLPLLSSPHKQQDKNFNFGSTQLGKFTPTSEDTGRFYFVHQNSMLLTEFRTWVDKHLLQTSYGQIYNAISPLNPPKSNNSSTVTEKIYLPSVTLKRTRPPVKLPTATSNLKDAAQFSIPCNISPAINPPVLRKGSKIVEKRNPHKKTMSRKNVIKTVKKLASSEDMRFSAKELLQYTTHQVFTPKERSFLRTHNGLGYGDLENCGWKYAARDTFDRPTNVKLRNF